MSKKTVLYIRTNTPEIAQPQIKELKRFCTEMNYSLHHTYVDIITTENNDPYKFWNQLMADSELEQFDLVVFWTYKSFGRKDRNMYRALLKLRKHHINWHSYSCQEKLFSTINPHSDTMNAYLDLFASVDKHQHGVSSKGGQEKAKRRGIHIGRSSIPDEARQKIIELRALGYSYSKIRSLVTYVDSNNKTRHPSKSTIHNVLKNYSNCSKSDENKKAPIMAENRSNRSKMDNGEVEALC